jgi:hypothetical protein
MIYYFVIYTIISHGLNARLQWSHNLTVGYSYNSCCYRNVALVRWVETDDSSGNITNMMDFNFDFPSAGQQTTMIEAYWCRDYSKCSMAQSIFRAFLHKITEYNTKNGSLGETVIKSYDLTTAKYGKWKETISKDPLSGVTLVYLNMSTTDGLFSLWSVYSPDTQDNQNVTHLARLAPKMVKFGIIVQGWKFQHESNVLAIEASFGSKGTASTYKLINNEMQLVPEALYGDKINFTLQWEPTAKFDGKPKQVTPIGSVSAGYSSVKFQLGDSSFGFMDWDPSIGLASNLGGLAKVGPTVEPYSVAAPQAISYDTIVVIFLTMIVLLT